ncbi:SusD/RagB family nutrient-binding outer membrane lipoprotein [Sabulilitoribacter arenilitoris]|uniref:SusD/RagB family nutrient-binding outer membrane lipoprotein n=1 Tax=Wocania arenilitoris TaxID=2044858 RepID=A0AAE3JNR2_9FLAO|nr:SusD/RagB family nutrient-binding outer membrane lipoprotein [Wocania arenilitoris]MCF7567505.1 SusD/RagB family nutrient-binding outer membrane lipoprotein [Wocania arenilitoris]
MKTINFKIKYFLLLVFAMTLSCETTELDLVTDPSNPTPDSADANLLFNAAQINFTLAIAYNEDNEDGLNVRAAEAARMQHLFGAYAGPFSLTSSSLDESWENLYLGALKEITELLPIAENNNQQGIIGAAKIIRAYTMVTLVDIFGDVPFSEATQGLANPNPKVDSAQSIYDAILVELDEAIAALNTQNVIMPANDLFYGGDPSKWITLARTLKLKMYLQMRLIGNFSSQINTLISQGIIDEASEDFQFQYSTVVSPNDSRHPYFALCYDADGADDYLTSYYVYLLKDDKGFNDPRLRYYFYRQTTTVPTEANQFLECAGLPLENFCYLDDLYWTRDHGNDNGVAPDQLLRSTYGLYPIGGAFDSDQFLSVTDTNLSTGNGAGIFPFMLSSYVKFLLAESALMSGTTGNPKTLLEEGIRASMSKVLNFPGPVDAAFAASQTDVDDYVAYVLGEYDAASSDDERLDIIMKEYYIALWGNGIEAYNNYRRTGLPSDMPPHVSTPGDFPRSFMYPAIEVNSNSNVSQKTILTKVFWDTNPDNFID